ncbi:hypothetical protein PIB30_014668, partial [Stylosanthes scabra]|nr:hypothetical protein [Stylosanthes scabra]
MEMALPTWRRQQGRRLQRGGACAEGASYVADSDRVGASDTWHTQIFRIQQHFPQHPFSYLGYLVYPIPPPHIGAAGSSSSRTT